MTAQETNQITTVTSKVSVPKDKVKEAKKPKGPAPYRHEDLILVPATGPEIIHRTWTNNMEEWGKGVPLSQYHAREKHMGSTAFATDNRLITWVLVPKPDADVTDEYKAWSSTMQEPEAGAEAGVHGGYNPKDTSEQNLERIMGAVETYERPGMVATVGKGEDGELKDMSSVSVASVYAPTKYRNHGYGKLMMKLLWKKVEDMGAAFSFLYSDLGAQFYTNFGWTARTSTEIVIPPSHTLPAVGTTEDLEIRTTRSSASANSVVLEPVTENSLQSLVERDGQLLRLTMKHKVDQCKKKQQQQEQNGTESNSSVNTTFVAVTPEIRSFQWLFARAWFNASEIWKFEEKQPRTVSIDKDLHYGVRVPGCEDQFLLWHHDFTDDSLFILRWRIERTSSSSSTGHEDSHDAIALAFVKTAQQEAKKWNLSKIVYWNGNAALAKLLGLEIRHRDHSISSLGLVKSDQPEDSVQWILNEKYSWC